MKKLHVSILTVMALMTAAGCVPQNRSSFESMRPDYAMQMRDLSSSIADDIQGTYRNKMIYVDAEHTEGSFADRLRAQLAKRGMLSIKANMADLSVRYALDELDSGTGYINLRFSDGHVISRSFPLIPENTYRHAATQNTPKPAQPKPAVQTPLKPGHPKAGPAESALREMAPPTRWYTIKNGDNVGAIARAHGCTKQDIYSANGGMNRVLPLNVGARIKLPPNAVIPAAAVPTPPSAPKPVPPAPRPRPAVKSGELPPPLITMDPKPTAQAASWKITPGSLKNQVRSWCAREGWQLVWDTPMDLEMRTAAVFTGDFRKAVVQLFDGLHENGHPLTASLFQPNRVLRIGDR